MFEKPTKIETFAGLSVDVELEREVTDLLSKVLGTEVTPAYSENTTYYDITGTNAALDGTIQSMVLADIESLVGDEYDVGIGSRVHDNIDAAEAFPSDDVSSSETKAPIEEVLLFITPKTER